MTLRKVIDFCKKPLILISAVVFLAFFVMLIVLVALPHAKKYTYNLDSFGTSVNMEIEFVDEDTAKLDMIATVIGEGTQRRTIECDWEIRGGYLYLTAYSDQYEGEYAAETIRVGKINAFRIEFDLGALMGQAGEGSWDLKIDLVCKTTTTLRGLSIAFIVIGAVFEAFAILVKVLDDKGVIKLKGEKQAEGANPEIEVKVEEGAETESKEE